MPISGSTSVSRKLGIVPGARVLLVDAPKDWHVPDLDPEVPCRRSPLKGRAIALAPGYDVVIAFCASLSVLEQVPPLGTAIRTNASLWVAWPRRAGGHRSEVTDNLVRDALLPLGLVDTKVAAIDDDWSGLRFVWRRSHR